VVFNKMDRVEDPSTRILLRHRFPDAVFISVHTGEGIDTLIERISAFLEPGLETVSLRIPHGRGDLLARVHREGRVGAIEMLDDVVAIEATLPQRSITELRAALATASD
jgi:GTP-binding protein HflX